MTPRKKLIEVALPLEAINVASAREKSIRHGHPSTLHLWWARRPLAAARAVIFTSLVDDPDNPNAPPEFVEACRKLPAGANASVEDTPRQRLFDFIETLVKWESTTDETVLNTARELIKLSTDGNPPPLLDPFAGGGSIPLEAQRFGLEAHASDLNPVAVMINKALIEIPPRFANLPPVNPRDRGGTSQGMSWKGAQGLAADVRYYGEWMRDRAWERIGHLYPKGPNGETVIAWLWARTVKCPNPACGATIPLTSTQVVCNRKQNETWVESIIRGDRTGVFFKVRSGRPSQSGSKIGRGIQFKCPVCGQIAPEDYVKSEGVAKGLGAQMLAIVTEGNSGRSYYAPTQEHEEIASSSYPDWRPAWELSTHPQYMAPPRYGMSTLADLFSPRQTIALDTLSQTVTEAIQQVLQDADQSAINDRRFLEYAEAVGTYLGLAVGRQANRLSTLCFWDTGRENVQQVFSRQALTMNWNYTEANPFSSSSGNFLGQVEYTARSLEQVPAEKSGTVRQQDAVTCHYENSYLFSTDPPYYDNVPYADLSDFFYVWLRRSIGKIHPRIFSTVLVPKDDELVADHQRHNGREAANAYFEQGLFSVFKSMRSSIRAEYPLTVYYAFRQAEIVLDAETGNSQEISSTGWESMLAGLIDAGFAIQGTWPIRTEQTTNIKKFRNALASSIVLVCRPRPEDASTISRREFVNALRRELPPALREMQSGSIAPVDLAQASIGPGMAVYSRYRQVLEADGSPLTVRTALQLINQELDAFLAETEGDVDADTRFAVSWFEQYGFKAGEFGVADVLARAKNTSVDGLVNAGVVEAGAGKVRLMTWDELDPGWTPQGDKRVTVWEAVHHLIERLNTHGEQGAAALLAQMDSDLAAEAKNLAYRLYQICDRKGWAEYALEYNAVVLSWPGVQQQATVLKQSPPPEQLGMF